MTKVTYRKKTCLFSFIVLEGLESILVGGMTANIWHKYRKRLKFSSHAESQENSERQIRHTGNDTRLEVSKPASSDMLS